MKVIINRGIGPFRFSNEAILELKTLGLQKIIKGKEDNYRIEMFHPDDIRTNPMFVKVVEKLGIRASGVRALLKVVEIPDNIEYYIEDKHNVETIHEKHRVWC